MICKDHYYNFKDMKNEKFGNVHTYVMEMHVSPVLMF